MPRTITRLLLAAMLLATMLFAATGNRESAIHVRNDDPNKRLYVQCIPTEVVQYVKKDRRYNCADQATYRTTALDFSTFSSSYSGREAGGGNNDESLLSVVISPCPDFSEFNLTLQVMNPHILTPRFTLTGYQNGIYLPIQSKQYAMDENQVAYFNLPGSASGAGISVRRAEDSKDNKEWWLYATPAIPKCSKA